MSINKTITLFFIISILYFVNNVYSMDTTTEQDMCLLDKDPGLCRASFTSYYYDSSKNDCFKFIFGGCGGNANNFKTYKDCIEKCKSY